MKMKFYFIPLLLFGLLFFSCNSDSNNIVEQSNPVYKISKDDVTTLDVTKIADFSTLIPLETTDQSIIGQIKKVFLVDSLIVVWDSQMNNVLLFNDKGDFKYKIGKQGGAPEEYIKITDVCLTPQNTLQILDNGSRRILTFSLDGKYVKKDQLDYYLYSFFSKDNEIWGVNSYQNKDNYYLIHIPLATGKIDYGYFPNMTKLILKQTNNFTENEVTKELLFHYSYDDNIYKIDSDKMTPFVSIDFEDKKAAYNYDKSEELEDKLNSTNYLGEINSVYAYGDNLFLSFKEHKAMSAAFNKYNVHISTKTQEVIVYEYDIKHSDQLNISPLPDIVAISKGKLIYQIIPEILSPNLVDKFRDMIPENREITEDSNPILVLYNLK